MPFNVAPGYCLVNPDDRPAETPAELGYGKVIEVPAGAVFPVVNSFVFYRAANAVIRPGAATPAQLRLYLPIADIVAVKV